jgi:hypothetical protein
MKHIATQYFFVTDRVAKGHLKVEWCPTAEMIADFMSKPLQGLLRDIIMGAEIVKSDNGVSNKSDKNIRKVKSNGIKGKKLTSHGNSWHIIRTRAT